MGNEGENDNNHAEFAANRNLIVSKMACMVNCMSENLLKLHTDVVKAVVE